MPDFETLTGLVSRLYIPLGRFTEGFVRGKLRHDLVYAYLLQHHDWLPKTGLLLDLGCGRGILLSLLATAIRSGVLPGLELRLMGIERRRADAGAARTALGHRATILQGDICQTVLPACHTIVLLDVLLYLTKSEQEAVLVRAASTLEPGGVLILREADADAGWRFRLTQTAETLCAWSRGLFRQRYHYRSALAWRSLLESLGFTVVTAPMSEGTPFSNILFTARKPR